jgi:hypothetical protein
MLARRWAFRLPLTASIQPLDLGLGQVLAGPKFGVGTVWRASNEPFGNDIRDLGSGRLVGDPFYEQSGR